MKSPPKKPLIIQSARKDLQKEQGQANAPMTENPFADKPKPLWLRALLNPLFWPIPAVIFYLTILMFGKNVWVEVWSGGGRGRPSPHIPGRQMMVLLTISLAMIYIPWQRFMLMFGGSVASFGGLDKDCVQMSMIRDVQDGLFVAEVSSFSTC